jgi:hypothetical protein
MFHPGACAAASAPGRRLCALFLAPGTRALGCTERYSGTHGFLLNRRCSAPKLLGNLTGRSARLRQSLQCPQFARAPGRAVIRWTSSHRSSPQVTQARAGRQSYTESSPAHAPTDDLLLVGKRPACVRLRIPTCNSSCLWGRAALCLRRRLFPTAAQHRAQLHSHAAETAPLGSGKRGRSFHLVIRFGIFLA